MMLQLVRTETIKDNDGEPLQTIGWLYVFNEDNELVGTFATLELPWKKNKTGISCIPPGPDGYKTYDIELLDDSPSFPYQHYVVKDVPKRTYIKIHRGNYYNQIEGCILIGMEFKDINYDNIKDVTRSTEALKKLIAMVGKKGELHIKNLA